MGFRKQSSARKKAYPWQRRRRRLLFVMLAALVPVMCYLGWRAKLRGESERLLQALRAEHLPVTMGELQAGYAEVPDAENAALLYIKAYDERHPLSPQDADKIPFSRYGASFPDTAAYPEETRARMTDFLAQYTGALKYLHEAASKPRCHYPIDLGKGPFAPEPYLDRVGEMRLLLGVQIALSAENGHLEQSVSAWEDLLALGRSWEKYPTASAQNTRTALTGFCKEVLRRILTRNTFPELLLQRLQSTLEQAHNRESLSMMYKAEMCTMLWSLQNAVSQRRSRQLSKQFLDVLTNVMGTYESGRRRILQRYQSTMSGVDKPLWVLMDMEEREEKRFYHDVSVFEMMAGLHYFGGRVGYGFVRSEAMVLMMETACALERYRNAKGALPDSLDALTPAYLASVPMDPCDGKPLRYRREPVGYVVYSVDMNRKDDGAPPPDPEHPGNQPDNVLRIER